MLTPLPGIEEAVICAAGAALATIGIIAGATLAANCPMMFAGTEYLQQVQAANSRCSQSVRASSPGLLLLLRGTMLRQHH